MKLGACCDLAIAQTSRRRGMGKGLARRPLRMARKEAVAKADLAGEKKSESQTYQAGSKPEPVRETLILSSEEVEGRSDAHGNEHHAGNGANAEDEQVNHCPARIAYGSQYEQGNGGRTREAVNDPYKQWTQLTIEADLAKHSIEPRERLRVCVRVGMRTMNMRMTVCNVLVNMGVSVRGLRHLRLKQ